MKIKNNLQKGFTLIELLVVISIISLLSSIILASIQDARQKSQVAAFREYVHQLVAAVELYKNDGNNPNTSLGQTGTILSSDNVYPNGLQLYFFWTPLSNYIKFQYHPIVNQIEFKASNSSYFNPLSIQYKICGTSVDETEMFIIRVNPNIVNINNFSSLPILYNGATGLPYTSSGYNYYCFSTSDR